MYKKVYIQGYSKKNRVPGYEEKIKKEEEEGGKGHSIKPWDLDDECLRNSNRQTDSDRSSGV